MTQLYATGSAQPLTQGTISFFVQTPVEPTMNIFIQGFCLGIATSIFIIGLIEFFHYLQEK